MLAISEFWLWMLKLAVPMIIGSILAAVPLCACIKALRNLLDTLIAANADGKITQKEFDQICKNAKKFKSSLVALLKIFITNGKGPNMKIKTMLLILGMVAACLLTGCATGTLESTRILPDGTILPYKVNFTTIGQDFKGSELAANLDPTGATSVTAGSVDNTFSPVAGDISNTWAEVFKILLPLAIKGAAAP